MAESPNPLTKSHSAWRSAQNVIKTKSEKNDSRDELKLVFPGVPYDQVSARKVRSMPTKHSVKGETMSTVKKRDLFALLSDSSSDEEKETKEYAFYCRKRAAQARSMPTENSVKGKSMLTVKGGLLRDLQLSESSSDEEEEAEECTFYRGEPAAQALPMPTERTVKGKRMSAVMDRDYQGHFPRSKLFNRARFDDIIKDVRKQEESLQNMLADSTFSEMGGDLHKNDAFAAKIRLVEELKQLSVIKLQLDKDRVQLIKQKRAHFHKFSTQELTWAVLQEERKLLSLKRDLLLVEGPQQVREKKDTIAHEPEPQPKDEKLTGEGKGTSPKDKIQKSGKDSVIAALFKLKELHRKLISNIPWMGNFNFAYFGLRIENNFDYLLALELCVCAQELLVWAKTIAVLSLGCKVQENLPIHEPSDRNAISNSLQRVIGGQQELVREQKDALAQKTQNAPQQLKIVQETHRKITDDVQTQDHLELITEQTQILEQQIQRIEYEFSPTTFYMVKALLEQHYHTKIHWGIILEVNELRILDKELSIKWPQIWKAVCLNMVHASTDIRETLSYLHFRGFHDPHLRMASVKYHRLIKQLEYFQQRMGYPTTETDATTRENVKQLWTEPHRDAHREKLLAQSSFPSSHSYPTVLRLNHTLRINLAE